MSANLPDFLWVEIAKAAVYLHNRSPRYQYYWKSPYERFFTYMANKEVPGSVKKPDQAHLRTYSCKAYIMTTKAMKKEHKLDRLKPKA